MRFVLSVDQAIAATVLAFCLGIGWTLGTWLAGKLLSLIK
jgi:hypothetical protein